MSQRENVYQFVDVPRVNPPKEPMTIRRHQFVEIYQPFTQAQAIAQADRCLACGNPYCQNKCPLHNNIPNWLRLANEGRIIEAVELAHNTNSLPEVCGRVCPQDRLCEGDCTLNAEYGAVTIGAIEKYITEQAFAQGWRPDISHVEKTDKKVAVIGAGPAGLACADKLIRNGIAVTVFERAAEIGGLLTFGIPSFKLEKEVMKRRRHVLSDMGIEFKLGVNVGEDISLEEIASEYDAVFLAVGTYQGLTAGIENEQAQGVYLALPYLIGNTEHLLNLPTTQYVSLEGKRVVVLGGGDTAMDCIRTAVRQQASEVICAYRRDEANMPGSKREFNNAKEEGAKFKFNLQPLGIVTDAGNNVTGLRVVKTALGQADEHGRRRAEVIAGTEEIISCDAVIVAFGFAPHAMPWLSQVGVTVDERGKIQTCGKFKQQTANPKIFAGGDITRGSDLVVTAIAEGQEAAQSIMDHLEV